MYNSSVQQQMVWGKCTIVILHNKSLSVQQFAAQGLSEPDVPSVYSVILNGFFFHEIVQFHLESL